MEHLVAYDRFHQPIREGSLVVFTYYEKDSGLYVARVNEIKKSKENRLTITLKLSEYWIRRVRHDSIKTQLIALPHYDSLYDDKRHLYGHL